MMQNPRIENDLPKKMLKGANILFVMHTRVTVFLNLFRKYTSTKCNIYTIIDHPLHPLASAQSKLSVYKKGKMQKHSVLFRIPGPYSLNFLKDFFLTIFWGMKTGFVYNIAFGANNLNTLSLLVLKKLGRVKKVIFISIDYTPNRYDNPILDSLYHWFDRIACYSADVIWNSSGRMNQARVRNGVIAKKIAHTIVMPDGSNFDYRKRLPIDKIDRNLIIFAGHMRPVMGVELILDALIDVLKTMPAAKLLLIGGGPELEKYKQHAKKLGLEKKAVFTGFLQSHDEVDDLLCRGAIGLALFAPDKSSYEYYSDVGKPKAYLAAGMPVIITRVPEIADIIDKNKAGIVIKYDKKELVNALVTLLKDDKMYKEHRNNAISLSKKYIWNNIFQDTFDKTFKYFLAN